MQNGRRATHQPKQRASFAALQSGGHRAPPAPSRKALKMPREAMSDISSWPKPKHSPAMWSALRTITSTLNII